MFHVKQLRWSDPWARRGIRGMHSTHRTPNPAWATSGFPPGPEGLARLHLGGRGTAGETGLIESTEEAGYPYPPHQYEPDTSPLPGPGDPDRDRD